MINADYVDDISNGDPRWGPVDNRYTKIHVLFRELALEKNLKDISQNAFKIKKFWKDFFSIDSLTELSDKELHNFEDFIEKRIKAVEKKL